MTTQNAIKIGGARQHNLQNISLSIPREQLVVITGPSGSGKSSLAFDTLYAEGRRRYVESLSAYARQFLDQLQKPEVDFIEGLSPAIALEQRAGSANPRSTIATTTEIYDYLRLLYASVGTPHDPASGRPLRRETPQTIVDELLALPAGTRLVVLAPLVRGQKGEFRDVLEKIRREGFVRARVDGQLVELGGPEPVRLAKQQEHTIEAVVDRIVVKEGVRTRLSDSVETALRWGRHHLHVLYQGPAAGEGPELVAAAGAAAAVGAAEEARRFEAGVVLPAAAGPDPDGAAPAWREVVFSSDYRDPVSGFTLPALTTKHFSFNSHLGACPTCHGLGNVPEFDPALVLPDPEKTLAAGAVAPWHRGVSPRMRVFYQGLLRALATHFEVNFDQQPVGQTPPEFRRALLEGTGEQSIPLRMVAGAAPAKGRKKKDKEKEKEKAVAAPDKPFEGVLAQVRHLYDTTQSELTRQRLRAYQSPRLCPDCGGARLRPEILAVTLRDEAGAALNIRQFCALTIAEARGFVGRLALRPAQRTIVAEVVREVGARLGFLGEVGLDYLTLDRESGSLSGGEAQRIRLAAQIGSGLAGVLYVLDEPSIGLHQRDNDRLVATLRRLRDLGNTVVVVEHDEDTIRAADWVVDIGPGAGPRGGRVVAQGTVAEVAGVEVSPTGQYLSGRLRISVPRQRVAPAAPPGPAGWLTVVGARENNLRDLTVSFPLGCLTCVTGVSGSGKSTLVDDILRRALARHFYRAKDAPGRHERIEGIEQVDHAIVIDQSPIGRSPRSNPATYSGAFGPIRELFSQLPAARVRGYDAGRFSFNVRGGRCEHCQGDGLIRVEMQFLPDVYVPCEVCEGQRYNRETLEISYKGKNVADVLAMSVEEATRFFRTVPAVADRLEALEAVGLGYLRLGQAADTLSGGEAQRVKLAAELAKKSTGRTVYLFDEPTTGLHFVDIAKLLEVFYKLREAGNTLIVIEHNLEIIKCADWVIDLGPEGGVSGGRLVGTGSPERIASLPASHTGRYLLEKLRG